MLFQQHIDPVGLRQPDQPSRARLQRAGYEITSSAFYGREGSVLRSEDGLLELPCGVDALGNDIVSAHRQYVGADEAVQEVVSYA